MATEVNLPTRTPDTMSEAIALSSPAGKISKRAKATAEKRLAESLFGRGGLQREQVKQPTEVERLERMATEAEGLAARGMRPRANKKLAEELHKLATAELANFDDDPLDIANRELDEAKASLEALQVRGVKAPKFGTKERAEFDVAMRGKQNRQERIGKAKQNVKQAESKLDAVKEELGLNFEFDAPAEDLTKPRIRFVEFTPSGQAIARKETLSISFRAAEDRFTRKTAGVGRAKQRNPELDAKRTAKTVAPAIAKTEADLKLQQRWFKHPNQLDFEGVDTKKAKPKARIKSGKL